MYKSTSWGNSITGVTAVDHEKYFCAKLLASDTDNGGAYHITSSLVGGEENEP